MATVTSFDKDKILELLGDVVPAGGPFAPLADAHLTGVPTAPTAAPGTNTTQIATTAFAKALVDALLASPAFTGNPTAPTQAPGNNSTRLATTAFVAAALAALVNSSPAALDTLNELAASLANDPDFAGTMIDALAGKQAASTPLTQLSALTETDDSFIQGKAGVWSKRTVAQVIVDLIVGGVNAKDVPMLGSSLLFYGHSWLAAGGVTNPLYQAATLLGGMLRSDGEDKATAASLAGCDENWLGQTTGKGGWASVLQSVVPSGGGIAPRTPVGFLPIIATLGNDINWHSHDANGYQRNVAKEALRTICSRCLAADVRDNGDASIALGGGTWQAVVTCNTRNSGASHQPVAANGNTITITIPADFEGGYIAVGFTVFPFSAGTITWSGTAFTAGGGSITNPGAKNVANLAYKQAGLSGTAARDSSNGITVRFLGAASDAGRTIIATIGGLTGTTQAAPAQPGVLTVTDPGGPHAITYGYQWALRFPNGDTVPSTERQTAAGPTALDATHYVTIPAPGSTPQSLGADYWILIRKTHPSGAGSQGIIAILDSNVAVDDKGTANGGAGWNNNPLTAPIAYTAATVGPPTDGFSFDYWQMESTPATVGIVNNIARWLDAGTNAPGGGYLNGATDADVANYNTDLNAVVAEFPSLSVFDMDAVLNKTPALFAADNTHPNNKGHEKWAAALYTAIQTLSVATLGSTVAAQSRIRRGVNSRRVSNLYFDYPNRKSGGLLAAANLPATDGKQYDYQLDATFRFLDNVNLWWVFTAEVGDDIEIDLTGCFGPEAGIGQLDAALVDSTGTAIRYLSSQTSVQLGLVGYAAWYTNAAAAAVTSPVSGRGLFTLKPTDLYTAFGGIKFAAIRLMGRSPGGTPKSLYAGGRNATYPLLVQIKNLSATNSTYNTS